MAALYRGVLNRLWALCSPDPIPGGVVRLEDGIAGEIEMLRAELARVMPVVEAAERFRDTREVLHSESLSTPVRADLWVNTGNAMVGVVDAVDALRAAREGAGKDE
jgi:hypothetical protein